MPGTGRGEAKAPPCIAPTPPLRVEMGGEIEGHDDAEAEVEKKARRDLKQRTTTKNKNQIYLRAYRGTKGNEGAEVVLFISPFFFFLCSPFCDCFLCDE